jgi:hypothetical protein
MMTQQVLDENKRLAWHSYDTGRLKKHANMIHGDPDDVLSKNICP